MIVLKAFSKSMDCWLPGKSIDEIANIIYKHYRGFVDEEDIIVVSEKPLAIALGYIYDENIIVVDPITKVMAKAILFLWCKILNSYIKSRSISMICSIDDEILARHKKLALKVGGIKHFLKPISEAGIDTTNLPYTYVSLPLRNAKKIAMELKEELSLRLGMDIDILIVDTDRTFQLKTLSNIAFATRATEIPGIIDLGFIAYLLGKTFREIFIEYPTPIAFTGKWIGLKRILRIAYLSDKVMGYGIGRNFIEMIQRLRKHVYEPILWRDICLYKHRPVAIVKRYQYKK